MNRTDLFLRLRALVFRRRAESELEDELRFHLEMEARKHAGRGLDDAEARRRALVGFGGAARAAEECRDARGTRWIENLFQDLRFGARTLAKDRGFTLAAVGALAVGIGANTALFTVFTAVALKPLPVRDPKAVVSLYRTTPQIPGGLMSFAEYAFYRDRSSTFAEVAAEQPAHLRLMGPEASGVEPVQGLFVTANFFTTFGVTPVAGRGILPGDEARGGPPFAALLSEPYWQRRFGRDPGIIGRTLLYSGIPVRIVGITPRDFMSTRPDVPDVWVAMEAQGDLQQRARDRATLCCQVNARLKPGATLRDAQAELPVLAATLRGEYPENERRWSVKAVAATRFGAAHDPFQRLYLVLQAGMALVLLIACANAAGLLLGRAAARQKEIAVRLAVGATRQRLVRQLVTEGVLLAALAGALGLVVTWQGLTAILKRVSAAFAVTGGTIALDLTPDLHVFLYILAITVAAGIVFALAPALQATRPDIVAVIREESAGIGGRGRLRGWIVAGQISVCLSLLIGAGMLAMNSVRMLTVDPGYETRSVLSMVVSDPRELGYSRPRMLQFQDRMLERLRGIPGIASVSFTTHTPVAGNVRNTAVAPADGTVAAIPYPYSYVSDRYFETLGLPLLRGREFNTREMAAGAPVAVISEGLARRLYPSGDALGKRIAVGAPSEAHFGPAAPLVPAAEVIGIARDAYTVNLVTPDPGYLYLPGSVEDWHGTLLLRANGDAAALAAAAIREVRAAEPSLPVTAETLRQSMTTGESATGMQAATLTVALIGGIGFALATVGVYSMVAFSVSRQRREVGIRMALGAQRRDVLRVLMRATLRWIGSGVAAGVVMGIGISRGLSALLQGQKLLDPWVLIAVSAITALLALLAAWFPARRAAAIDPAITLRAQ